LECNAYNRIREQAIERHNHILKKAIINFPFKWDEQTSLGILEDPRKRLPPKIKQKTDKKSRPHKLFYLQSKTCSLLEKQGMFRDESDKGETRKSTKSKRNTPNIDNLKPKESPILTSTNQKPTRQRKPYWAYSKRYLRARNTKPKRRRKELPQTVKTLISNTTTRSININSHPNIAGQSAINSIGSQSSHISPSSSQPLSPPYPSSTSVPDTTTEPPQQTPQISTIKRKRIPDNHKTTQKKAKVLIHPTTTATIQNQPNTNNKKKGRPENTANSSKKRKNIPPRQVQGLPKHKPQIQTTLETQELKEKFSQSK
jgi:hypothetical protein